MSGRRPHEILGLVEGASLAQVRQRYYRLAKLYHPDRPGGDAAKFVEVHSAYQALSGEAVSGGCSMGNEDFTKWFADLATQRPSTTSRTSDVIYTLLVKPGSEGACFKIPHVQNSVTFHQIDCARCHGTGYVGDRQKFVCQQCMNQRETTTKECVLLEAKIPECFSGCVFVFENMAFQHPDKDTGDVLIVAELDTGGDAIDHQIVQNVQETIDHDVQYHRRARMGVTVAATSYCIASIPAALLFIPTAGVSFLVYAVVGVGLMVGLGAYSYHARLLRSEQDVVSECLAQYSRVIDPHRIDSLQSYADRQGPETFSIFDDLQDRKLTENSYLDPAVIHEQDSQVVHLTPATHCRPVLRTFEDL